jgi:hypothetical protein
MIADGQMKSGSIPQPTESSLPSVPMCTGLGSPAKLRACQGGFEGAIKQMGLYFGVITPPSKIKKREEASAASPPIEEEVVDERKTFNGDGDEIVDGVVRNPTTHNDGLPSSSSSSSGQREEAPPPVIEDPGHFHGMSDAERESALLLQKLLSEMPAPPQSSTKFQNWDFKYRERTYTLVLKPDVKVSDAVMMKCRTEIVDSQDKDFEESANDCVRAVMIWFRVERPHVLNERGE